MAHLADPEAATEALDESFLMSDMEMEGLSQKQFDEKYGRVPPSNKNCLESVKDWCKSKCACSKKRCGEFLTSEFPIIDVIRTYKPQEYILGDIFSGISLGFLNVPQGMGYSLLASIAPIYGIYTSIWPPFIYIFFGTSHHIGMGTMALSSLIVGDVIKRETFALEQEIDALSVTGNDTSVLVEQLKNESESIFILLTLLCGVCSYLMGIFRLGVFTDYIGEAFLGGFLAGANIRVLSSQIIQMLQIKVHPFVGPLSLIYTLIDLCKNIQQTNIAALIISLISVMILLVVKYAINERFKSKLKVPIPIDLIVVVIVTIICYFGQFEEKYGVRIIKEIPSGMPRPSIPPIQRSADFIVDGLVLALVGYIIGYIMAKIFSQRHHYACDPNQELKAIGMCNVISSFFVCLPSSSSPPRCFIMEQTGGKTQFANVLSGFIVMMFLFFAGPLLEPMPVCVLNAMILAGCVPILAYYKLLPLFWKTNKYDFAIYIVTWVSMITLTLNLGIIVGILFSVFTVVYRTQYAHSSLLSPVQDHSALVNPRKYSKLVTDIPGTKIFQFTGPLCFATITSFKDKLFASTVSPLVLQKVMQIKVEEEKMEMKPNGVHESNPEDDIDPASVKLSTPLTQRKSLSHSKSIESTVLQKIIIDASAIGFADTSGAKMLANLHSQYSNSNVEFIMAGCNESVKQQLDRVLECQDLKEKGLCPSVQDAILL